jgi:hypothetical protein
MWVRSLKRGNREGNDDHTGQASILFETPFPTEEQSHIDKVIGERTGVLKRGWGFSRQGKKEILTAICHGRHCVTSPARRGRRDRAF